MHSSSISEAMEKCSMVVVGVVVVVVNEDTEAPDFSKDIKPVSGQAHIQFHINLIPTASWPLC